MNYKTKEELERIIRDALKRINSQLKELEGEKGTCFGRNYIGDTFKEIKQILER